MILSMNKPVFKYSKPIFILSAVLTIPLLIDICTACHLFPLWLAWFLFAIICCISIIRLWFGFSQKCFKFCGGLIAQLLLGAGVLTFFQLSYSDVIETPVSHPVTPAVVNIEDPLPGFDSIDHTKYHENKVHHVQKSDSITKHLKDDKVKKQAIERVK